MDLKHRWVHFQIKDVHIPEPTRVLHLLYENNVLQGKVIDVSENIVHHREFAVVQVEGLDDLLLVPIERILGVL